MTEANPTLVCNYLSKTNTAAGFYLNLPAAAVVTAVLVMIDNPERPVSGEKATSQKLSSWTWTCPVSSFSRQRPSCSFSASSTVVEEYPWKLATVIGLLVGAGGALRSVPGLGISPGRSRHYSLPDDQKEGGLFKYARWHLHHGHYLRFQFLPPHLLPGCQGCVAIHQRRLRIGQHF